jgi:hypothetical protein
MPESADANPTRHDSTFLVTATDASSTVLRDVESGQVYSLEDAVDADRLSIIDGTVESKPPLHVVYELTEITATRTVDIETSIEPPTANTKQIAANQGAGEITRKPRAGAGEIHIITVPEKNSTEAVADILDDKVTLCERAARLEGNRIEIRSAPGVVAVRYMP